MNCKESVEVATRLAPSERLRRQNFHMAKRSDNDVPVLDRLRSIGVASLEECLFAVPKAYIDLSTPVELVDPARHLGRPTLFRLTLRDLRTLDERGEPVGDWRRVRRIRLTLTDSGGRTVHATLFGDVWGYKGMSAGTALHLHGTLQQRRDDLQLSDLRRVEASEIGRVKVLYGGRRGKVSGEVVEEGVRSALPLLEEASIALLARLGLRPKEFSRVSGYRAADELLRDLHLPESMAAGMRAAAVVRRLACDTLVRQAIAGKQRAACAASSLPILRATVDALVQALPFTLTADQRRAIDETMDDLRSPFPMRRLLSGDVGTGKTAAFLVPVAAVARLGRRVCVMAPSSLIVEQTATDLRTWFPGLEVSEVRAGDEVGPGVVVGTTAVLGAAVRAGVTFDLLVIDEQHKFSTEQRSALVGERTNVLEATATAIPRTLALTQFGGMDLSALRQSPVRKVIRTRITTDEETPRLAQFIDQVLDRRGQIAVVYPLVEASGKRGARKSEAADLPPGQSVEEAFLRWDARYPGRVAALHGRMTSEEKSAVVASVHDGSIDILVCSLVVEIGVTLPSLRAMVILHPERYGLSQIHQLRGRVSRKGGVGYVFLHTRAPLAGTVRDRLELLTRCDDGFELAERDMDARGCGDVDARGDQQTGAIRPPFLGVSITASELRAAARRAGVAM
jgi:ATP-dependent DNA helicase RecG